MQEAAKYQWFGVARAAWPPPQRKRGAPAPPCLLSLHTHHLPCRTEAALAPRAGFGCGREGVWHCLLPVPFCHSAGYLASLLTLDSAGARR